MLKLEPMPDVHEEQEHEDDPVRVHELGHEKKSDQYQDPESIGKCQKLF